MPAADSLGIALDGFRVLGIDTTDCRPSWLDSAKFRKLIPFLPKPLKIEESVKTLVLSDGEMPTIASDSTSVQAKDSLMIQQRDSVSVNADSTMIIVPPADSLKNVNQ